ncbi:hypothetical protein LINPERHAP2_LOCUS16024 [Linum perenne]
MQGLRRNVGNGCDTWFDDAWFPGSEDFRCSPITNENCRISDCISQDRRCWDIRKLRSMFTENVIQEILMIPIGPPTLNDKWIWHFDSKDHGLGVYYPASEICKAIHDLEHWKELTFETVDELDEFCLEYAHEVGFGVRKMSTKKKRCPSDGVTMVRYFEQGCSKEGYKFGSALDPKNDGVVDAFARKRNHAESRVGCKTKVYTPKIFQKFQNEFGKTIDLIQCGSFPNVTQGGDHTMDTTSMVGNITARMIPSTYLKRRWFITTNIGGAIHRCLVDCVDMETQFGCFQKISSIALPLTTNASIDLSITDFVHERMSQLRDVVLVMIKGLGVSKPVSPPTPEHFASSTPFEDEFLARKGFKHRPKPNKSAKLIKSSIEKIIHTNDKKL